MPHYPHTLRWPSRSQETTGPPKFFDASLPACHSLRTPTDLHTLTDDGCFVLASGALKPSPSATLHFEAVPAFRARGCPCGLQDSLCTLHLLCSPSTSRLRRKCNTRYGWVVSPCPAGTFTQQDAPSLSWRDNAARSRGRSYRALHPHRARPAAVSLNSRLSAVPHSSFLSATLSTPCAGHGDNGSYFVGEMVHK